MTLSFEVKLFAILHDTSQSLARSLIALVKGYSGLSLDSYVYHESKVYVKVSERCHSLGVDQSIQSLAAAHCIRLSFSLNSY